MWINKKILHFLQILHALFMTSMSNRRQQKKGLETFFIILLLSAKIWHYLWWLAALGADILEVGLCSNFGGKKIHKIKRDKLFLSVCNKATLTIFFGRRIPTVVIKPCRRKKDNWFSPKLKTNYLWFTNNPGSTFSFYFLFFSLLRRGKKIHVRICQP